MLSLSVLNVGDDSGPSPANIAKMMQNTESFLGATKNITDQRFTAHKLNIKALSRVVPGMKKPR